MQPLKGLASPLHTTILVAAVVHDCSCLLQVHMACLKAGGQKGRRQKPEAFIVHRVQQGETAADIASLRGLAVADLEQANPGQWLFANQSMQCGSI